MNLGKNTLVKFVFYLEKFIFGIQAIYVFFCEVGFCIQA